MPIRNRQARSGEEVRHDMTGANGVVIQGGFRPRVQWLANGRTTRARVEEISEGHRPSRERAPGLADAAVEGWRDGYGCAVRMFEAAGMLVPGEAGRAIRDAASIVARQRDEAEVAR